MVRKTIEVHNPTEELATLVNRIKQSKETLISEMREQRETSIQINC